MVLNHENFSIATIKDKSKNLVVDHRALPDDGILTNEKPVSKNITTNSNKRKNEEPKSEIKSLIQKVKKPKINTNTNLQQAPTIPFSSMSQEQHLRFLQVNALYSVNFKEEKEDYMRWQYSRSIERVKYLDKAIAYQVERFYEVLSAIGLALPPPVPGDPVLKFVQQIYMTGKCYNFEIPPFASPIPIPLEKEYWHDNKKTINQNVVTSNNINGNHTDTNESNQENSQEKNDENNDGDNNKDLPKTDYWKKTRACCAHDGSIIKTVYIDKPLVKKKSTPRSRNQIFYNTAFKSMALKSKMDINDILNFKPTAQAFIKSCDNDKKARILGVKTKLEYQLDAGLEETTILERACWWIYNYIRPDAHLMLGRINVLNNELHLVEWRKMIDIIPDGNWPTPYSNMIHYIMKNLKGLPAGTYLLSKLKGEQHATIYRNNEAIETQALTASATTTPMDIETDDDADGTTINIPEYETHFYDLHKAHSKPPSLDRETIPFVRLKWNGPLEQVPDTFPIRTTDTRPPSYCHDFIMNGESNQLQN
ncbi:11570_t:CDS:10 [Entrophospora sp. SA101]|nr:11570_t:CDS:10 [Entrophospora sp. SA101]